MKKGGGSKKGLKKAKDHTDDVFAEKEEEPTISPGKIEDEISGKEGHSEVEKGEEELSTENLKASLDEQTKLAQDYHDRLLRTQAEFENFKKRSEKEMDGFRSYANAQLVRDLLCIIDDFQTAISSNNEGAEAQYLRGFEMIFKNLYSVLEKEGLSMINPKNEPFDPWKHEAVEMVPSSEFPEHTVISVIQPGYKFKDKIIRPAKVRVAVEPKPAGKEGKGEGEIEGHEDETEKDEEINDSGEERQED
ncbi:MAG: nucleotide exchange factor GrpE [Thermoplasmata archaeon]|nr:MAG: nucleotide exchange factor GrpE [Thermoplasmata archaeon]